MRRLGKFRDALALYRRHGWRLARVLMTPETLAELRAEPAGAAGDQPGATDEQPGAVGPRSSVDGARSDAESAAPRFEGVEARESDVDAMWLTRAAAGGREAWELRLVADAPFALFELFEPDEPEEDREDVRREMEARLKEEGGGRTAAEILQHD